MSCDRCRAGRSSSARPIGPASSMSTSPAPSSPPGTRCRSWRSRASGAIVNISSVAGLRFIGNHHAAYAAAKAGLVQFTKAVALQYASRGIRCNAISVGLMHTPLVEARLAAQYAGGALDARSRSVMPKSRWAIWATAGTSPTPPSTSAPTRPDTSPAGRSRRGRRPHGEVRLTAPPARPPARGGRPGMTVIEAIARRDRLVVLGGLLLGGRARLALPHRHGPRHGGRSRHGRPHGRGVAAHGARLRHDRRCHDAHAGLERRRRPAHVPSCGRS